MAVFALHIEATHQVGLVFLVGQPARCRAGCAALAQRKHAGTACSGGGEGIGMDADEQVGLHAPRFFHPRAQGHEVIAVAGQKRAHGVAAHGGGVDAVAQQVGHAQHHVFFARARRADGAGVFTAVAGVQRHDDDAVGLRSCGAPAWAVGGDGRGCRGGLGRGGRGTGPGAVGVLGNQVAQGVGRFVRLGGLGCGGACCGRCGCGVAQALGNQGFERVHRLGRVQVEHQAVLVGRNGRQGEHLGLCGLLQIDHQPHHARGVLPHADAGNVRIVRLDLGDQFAQFGAEVNAFDVHRQPGRGGHEKLLGHQLGV